MVGAGLDGMGWGWDVLGWKGEVFEDIRKVLGREARLLTDWVDVVTKYDTKEITFAYFVSGNTVSLHIPATYSSCLTDYNIIALLMFWG